ncbi:MAG: hypothetical protein KBS52_05980 [Clostridiales bacterium]|nr:hypothetical protein [Candidatus Equinaster intestinalis]
MVEKKKSNPLQALCFVGLFFIFFIITYTDIININIANASPFPLIALIVTVGFYYGEWVGFIAGTVCGIFADAFTPHSVCFNTLFLLFLGCATGALVKYIFNRNIFSASVITAVACVLYFVLELIFCITLTEGETYTYLLLYALPSAVYSAVFIIPFFYLGKLIKKI